MKQKILILMTSLLILALITTACTSTTPAATSVPAATEPQRLRVAMVLPCPISDQSWCSLGKAALDQIAVDFKAETAYQDSVKETDYVEAFRDFASQGFDVVIGHGEEFLPTSLALHAEFPNTLFVNPGGSESAGVNMIAVRTNEAQAAFVPGYIAGRMTKTHRIGVVGGLDLPGIIAQIEGFRQGAEYADPLNKVVIVYTGDGEDVSKAKEAALAQIDAGADVVFHIADAAGIGVLEAATERGVYAVGFGQDQSSLAPKAVITSMATLLIPLYESAISLWVNKTPIKPEVYFFGWDSPFPVMAHYDTALVPADILKDAADVEKMIADGKIVPEIITTKP